MTVPLDAENIQNYLDSVIDHWRKQRDVYADEEQKKIASCYVDAFQSVRVSLLGEILD